ncbi:MAG: S9 family peptidase, partial [Acidimicrobiia bacterium]
EAARFDYFDLGGFAISPDHQLVAWASDTTGGELLTLRFRDLATQTDLPDIIERTYYGLAWAADSRHCFYVRPDEAMRPYQVWRHELGTDPTHDVCIFEEPDEHFFVAVGSTRTERLIFVSVDSKTTSEVHFLPADTPTAPLRCVAPREPGNEYHVEHHVDAEHGDRFFILTNDHGAENFRLCVTPVDTPERPHWEEVLAADPAVRLDDVDAFAQHLVLSERADGLSRLRVLYLADNTLQVVPMPDEVYTAWMGSNPEFEVTSVRFGYTSMIAPTSDYRLDLPTLARTLIRQQPVRGGYDPAQYVTRRLWATAPDGTQVPISLAHRQDTPIDGSAPTLLYGYGSYEHSIDPSFSIARLSLLDRGFVFAIAHVRGGGEMGRHWYDNGKILHKRNTFTDFIACAQHLCTMRYSQPDRLVARGGSAGGLLMGAIANLAPDQFRAIVAEVPFVDCVTTILDPSLPLTITEWEEWGNPIEHKDVYEYMCSYSPYDNVEAKAYPAMYITAGLNDPRVQYWEPAKWAARLRELRTDDGVTLLETELGAGHHGPSGRYAGWRDEARVLSFICWQCGVTINPGGAEHNPGPA